MITAKWTGAYPNLCSGTWKLYKDGEDISDMIPEELRNSKMNTFGNYNRWHFEDWDEVWDSYDDGLDGPDWIKENDEWLSKITSDYQEKMEIFYAIQAEDWRHGSCGGCI